MERQFDGNLSHIQLCSIADRWRLKALISCSSGVCWWLYVLAIVASDIHALCGCESEKVKILLTAIHYSFPCFLSHTPAPYQNP